MSPTMAIVECTKSDLLNQNVFLLVKRILSRWWVLSVSNNHIVMLYILNKFWMRSLLWISSDKAFFLQLSDNCRIFLPFTNEYWRSRSSKWSSLSAFKISFSLKCFAFINWSVLKILSSLWTQNFLSFTRDSANDFYIQVSPSKYQSILGFCISERAWLKGG